MSAIWFRARAEWRARRRALISAALLCGLFGAAVLASLAGASRTQSAYPRFLQRQRALDVVVTDSTLFAPVFWKPDFEALARLPYVETAVRVVPGYVHAGADLPEGTGFVGSYDARYPSQINRPVMVRGRMPDPSAPNEIAVPYFGDRVNNAKHRDLGSFRVGDHVKLSAHDHDVTFTVVGETAIPGELPPQPQWGWQIQVSRAFLDTYVRGCEAGGPHCLVDFTLPSMLIRFKHRSDIASFQRDARTLTGGKVLAAQDQVSHARAVEGSADLQASALRLLALFIAVTGALIVGQMLAREIALGAGDAETLRALGVSRRQQFALTMVRMTPVAVAGGGVGMLFAWLCSPLFPRGSVRVVEPGSFAFEPATLLIGAVAIAVTVLGLIAWPAWRASAVARDVEASAPSTIASSFATLGFSAPAVAGARLALERGRGRTAVPVLSSIAVVALGIGSFVAATTVAVSLKQMIERPELYGKSWDTNLTTQADRFNSPGEQRALTARVNAALASDPDVAAFAIVDSGAPLVVFGPRGPSQGIPVLGLSIENLKGSLFPPIVEGHAPEAADEVVLGARMISALGIRLDPVHPPLIQIGLQGAGEKRVSLRVVGRGVIPPLGSYGELGFGVLVSGNTAIGELIPAGEEIPPTTESIIRWRPGANPEAVIARHAKDFPELRKGDSLAGGKFADAVNFGGVQGAPIVVGSVLALLGAAALAHVLVTSIRRRRRDLAILKAIGFVRGQARRAVAWQATIIVVMALVIGIPFGLIGGRWLWAQVADGIGVLPRPRISLPTLLLLVPSAIVLANLIAVLPARAAARTQPATVLRTE